MADIETVSMNVLLPVCLFVVYLEYINNYIVTHTVICNKIFNQGFIPKQSHGTDFHKTFSNNISINAHLNITTWERFYQCTNNEKNS